MSLQAETLQRIIGKATKDMYGRHIGHVVGISLDSMGQITSVGIDQGKDGLVEYQSSQLMADGDNLILIPSWRVEIEEFRKESALIQQRSLALEELLRDGEIPQYVYDELCQQYREALKELSSKQSELTQRLKSREEKLEGHIKSVERFIANVKVLHKTGEMSEENFKASRDKLLFEVDASKRELKDIQSALAFLAQLKGHGNVAEHIALNAAKW